MPESYFNYRGNLSSTANADLTRSRSIWYDCPWEQIRIGELEGVVREYDFTRFRPSSNVNASVAYWENGLNCFGDNGAAITVLDAVGGGSTVGSDGDNEGISFQACNLEFQISRSHPTLWFEILLQTSTIADTKHGWFAGLGDSMTLSATVPIAAAGTLADENFVGFHRLEGDGDAVDFVYKADGVTQVTVAADAYTIAAATDMKLGFKFEPARDPYLQGPDSDAKYLLTIYKDGVRHATTKQIPSAAGTDFPNDVRMGFLFALLNATASSPGTTTLKKAWVAQLL